MTVYTSSNVTGPEPYEPQEGYHRYSEGPPWCDNSGNPHEPGYCTAHVGHLDRGDTDLWVGVYSGKPTLSAYFRAGGDGEVANTAEDMQTIADWINTAIAMSREAAQYLAPRSPQV